MFGMLSVMYGSKHFSSTLAMTERSDMGLCELPRFVSLFGLGMGMMFASFQVCGMMLWFNDMLSSFVRYASPRGPMCLRCLMFMLLGPVELLFLLCCIASWTCLMVNVMVCVCSLRIFLSVMRFDLFVFRVSVFVNCLLNAFAISLGVVAVLLLNVIVLFLGCVGFLFERPLMVFQSVCVFVL